MNDKELFALDTNILVFADDPSSVVHSLAKNYLEEAFKGSRPVCLSPQILAEYFAVITNPKRIKNPLSVQEAATRVLFLNKSHHIKKIYPKHSALKRSAQFCAKHNIRGARIFDVFYALTLIDNGIHTLVTQNTKDFVFFKELKLINPFPLAV